MVQFCCVPYCTNRQLRYSGIRFHSFPKCEDLKSKWLDATKRFSIPKRKWRNPHNSVNKSTKVCSAHFLDRDYVFGDRKKLLKRDAVPSVFLWTDTNAEMHKKNVSPAEFVNVEESNEDAGCSKEDPMMDTSITVDILQNELKHLRAQNAALERRLQISSSVFCIEKFSSNEKIMYYTGFESLKLLTGVFNFLLPSGNLDDLCINPQTSEKHFPHAFSISPQNQFFLTLMQLRRGFDHQTIGDMFGISKSMVSNIFKCWLNLMHFRLGQLNIRPNRDVLISQLKSLNIKNKTNAI